MTNSIVRINYKNFPLNQLQFYIMTIIIRHFGIVALNITQTFDEKLTLFPSSFIAFCK